MTLDIGSSHQPFKLKGMDEQWHSLEDISKNKQATVIIFSCNHCPYVLAWEDRMIDLANTYGTREVAFVLINANDATKYPDDSFPKMQEQSRKKAYPFPYLHDEDQSVAKAYGATRTPEVFLFDKQQTLQYHGRIDDNYESPQQVHSHDLKNALESVLNGENPQTDETDPIGCTIKWK